MPIPQAVRATAAVTQRQSYRGDLRLDRLSRLLPALASSEGSLQVALDVVVDNHRDYLRGEVHGVLPLACTRCEKQYGWPLQASIDLCLVHDEDAERDAIASGDAWWISDDTLPLHDMIEDEVLLALPMLPRCESCENEIEVRATSGSSAQDRPVDEAAENPFAALKKSLQSKQQ